MYLCMCVCDPMDCSPPGSSVHGIFHTKKLEWIAISYSRRFSLPKDKTVSCAFSALAGVFFNTAPPISILMSLTLILTAYYLSPYNVTYSHFWDYKMDIFEGTLVFPYHNPSLITVVMGNLPDEFLLLHIYLQIKL